MPNESLNGKPPLIYDLTTNCLIFRRQSNDFMLLFYLGITYLILNLP